MIENTQRYRVEYIWLDGREPLPKMRGKTRFIDAKDKGSIPDWNFDGGSTNQGSLEDSDRCLKCVRTYKDPFVDKGLIALCEVTYHNDFPHESNTRSVLREDLKDVEDVWVGFEQEFTFINPSTFQPLGFVLNPVEQGQYYCGVGCLDQIGRYIVDEFEFACQKAGIELDGINAEVMPGQWEFQTKAQDLIKGSDDLWVARYLLERVAESKPVVVSYDPKPHPEFNGAGCHTNISTKQTRLRFREGYEIDMLMPCLEEDHEEHIKVCGERIEERMTGECETSDYKKFTWGVGDRGASVRIPKKVSREKKGYFEDRRPCANIDPYRVVSSLVSSLNKSNLL